MPYNHNKVDKQKSIELREKEFLEACGIDLKDGFFSEDVTYWKNKEPELYTDYVTNG